jgi:hypothetical protein
MNKTIRIACKGAAVLSIHEMTYFQSELKSLSKNNYERLKKEILTTGYGFPIKIWKDESDGKNYIIGGHQTYRTLIQLEGEGYEIPPVPVSYTFAKDFFEAKRRVLQDISEYGSVEREGLYSFMTQSNIEIDDLLGSFDIPDFQVESFKDEFFKEPNFQPGTQEEQGKLDEKHLIYITCPNCKERFERGQANVED